MKVSDIMTTQVVSVSPDSPFKEVLERLVESGVSGLPVLDELGALLGIVTEADLASKEAYAGRRRALAILADVLAAPEWVRKAGGRTAAEIMTRDVVVCDPDDDPRVVARRMLERRVKRMPVVRSGKVVGMVSRHDILKLYTRPDAEIADDVAATLVGHPNRPDDCHVRSSVESGIVTLTGDVRYEWDEPAVVSLVRDVAGVINVISNVHNREPNPRTGHRLDIR